MNLKRELHARILNHPDIEEKKSRFSGATAFYYAGKEIAHFHEGNEIDVRLTKQEIKKRAWGKQLDRRVSMERKNSDWVQLHFSKDADLEFVLEPLDAALSSNRKHFSE